MLPRQVVIKVVSQCNIACTYCYQDNLNDGTWRSEYRPMPPALFAECLDGYLAELPADARAIDLNIQGGEPLLVKKRDFARYLEHVANIANRRGIRIRTSIQTNALLLDDEWLNLLSSHHVAVGISLDGPPSVHDRQRVDRRGRGTAQRVEEKLRQACASSVAVGVICVIDPTADGASTYRYFRDLGVPSVHLLLPAQNYASSLTERDRRPFAPFLIGMFDAWLNADAGGPVIADFEEVVAALSGFQFRSWIMNAAPASWICFLPDGSVESGDPYGICESGSEKLASVRESVAAAMRTASFEAHIAPSLPDDVACQRCDFKDSCGGGFPAFRYSRNQGFRKRTVYCEDTRRFFTHVKHRLESSGVVGAA